MPITSERPGVFRGTKDGRTDWYVTDPARAAELEAEWKANWDGTNRTKFQWVVKWLVFVAVFVALVSGTILLAVSFAPGLVVLGGILAVIGGLVLGGVLAAKSFPRRFGGSIRIHGVVAIPAEVRNWADDTVSVTDLWELSVTVDRLLQVASSAWHWSEADDGAPDPYPEEIVEDVVMPALLKQWKLELKRLDELATPVGFPVPDGLREVPNPLASAPAPQS
jgi:hypothetical protein